jgi:carbon monoxide dehydrogenase subunit G
MHLEDSHVLKRPRAQVWEFISNPDKIAKCLPGLERLEVKDARTFSVTVKVGIAFVRGSFRFDFTLLDQNPPTHSRFEAKGKGAGVSVRLNATMDLKEVDANTTQLSWKTDAELGGLLGEISPSLIQNSTNKITQEFFDCIKAKLETATD